MKVRIIKSTVAVLAGFALAAGIGIQAAQEYVVAQQGRAFSKSELKIKAGDIVSFPNQDDFFHNVYSLSPTKVFDLGSYKKGETRKVVFEQKGTVEVRCAIHPNMKMKIVVE